MVDEVARSCPSCAARLPRSDYDHYVQCTRCQGFVLDGDLSRRVLSEVHDLSILDLRTRVDDATREYPCPNCDRTMKTVIVSHDLVDLCFGCGALFLDRAEAARVSGERVGAGLRDEGQSGD